MIPFRDYNPSGTVPFVTIGLIVVNVGVFLHQASLSGEEQKRFVFQYGIRPARVAAYVRGEPARGADAASVFLPFLTAMFLHGGWMHLIGNLWYLWIFGDNVEDRVGHVSFLIFYLVCGLGASVAHVAVESGADMPMVGASGAIAGVLGAYALAFPRARVLCIVPLLFLWTVVALPALVVLGFWFFLQFVSGLQTLRMPGLGGVAWWAHIGGFVLGMVLLGLFQKPLDRRRSYAYRR